MRSSDYCSVADEGAIPSCVAGVDEAGRGPLAGPVVAAAVVLDPNHRIEGLADSKVLSAPQRERLAEQIKRYALGWSVAQADVKEIERLNILHATLLAMRRAVLGLSTPPSLVLVDGNWLPLLPMPAQAVIGGDASVPAISAASILAKVARDRLCVELNARFPQYGFAQHKGYGTAQHLLALEQHGACAEHRRGFGPVARALQREANPLCNNQRRTCEG